MKKFTILTLFMALLMNLSFGQTADTVTLKGNITSNVTLDASKVYYMRGFVYVKNGATITIPAGTVIRGRKGSKATLIITRGSKIQAQGTAQSPIVFTSDQAAGTTLVGGVPVPNRNTGDIGGVIILGAAPTNTRIAGPPVLEGQGVIEGGLDPIDGRYGGNDANDNSGVFSYCRIEFGGAVFVQNNEVNGLTLGGVGAGTKIDHVMVSFCNDDSFEWFGGTVNCSHLIAHRGVDDDFDTDFGYNGNVQFALGVRAPNTADAAGDSNGFESDNDANGTFRTPKTRPTFSNVTLVGPRAPGATVSSFYNSGMRLRRRSEIGVFNSAVIGWPFGVYPEGNANVPLARNDSMPYFNNTLAGNGRSGRLASTPGWTYPQFSEWLTCGMRGNDTIADATTLGWVNPFALDKNAGLIDLCSPLMNGANFSHPRLANSFFTPTRYQGAFGTTDWTTGWANWDPIATNYPTFTNDPTALVNNINIAPSIVTNNADVNFYMIQGGNTAIEIYDLTGNMVINENLGKLSSGNQNASISIQNVPSGVYFLSINVDGVKATQKLVKQ
jgi:hypothetical protein